MKNKVFISILLAIVMTFACFVSCTPNMGDSSEVILQDGVITYEEAVCEVIKGVADSGTVATATASNGALISYSMTEEETGKLNNAFGNALQITADGAILGVYNTVKKFKVKVTASAEKCAAVTSEMTISVINPYLNYAGRQLADAKVDLPYAASVAYALDEDVEVTYSLSSKQKLPEGLTMTSDGTITGTPTRVGPGTPFLVKAKAKGFSDTEREFSIDVVLDHKSETASKIVNFGNANGVKELETAYIGSQYVNQAGVAGNASALNGNNITYELAEGSSLPAGLVLYPNGAIIGKADTRTECEFSVTATATGCETLTRSFKIMVNPKRIRFESKKGELTKGEAANYSIATADAGEGVEITYTMTKTDATKLFNDYGLTVSPEGMVTGTPTKVVELMSFKVTAEAEGFTPTSIEMYFRINEPLQAPTNGRFEAEYVDVTGKSGTGYSASPTGKDIIDTSLANMTSNGAFVNYMHNDTITLEFVIYAEADVSNAKLYIAAGSEMGTVTFTPSAFGVYTYEGNTTAGSKTTVNYGSVRVSGGDTYTSFDEYQFGTISLKQGWNVVQIAVHTNTLRGGNIGGPGVDYIRIDTSTTLKWVPCSYNVNKG